jgi:ParB family chromosome partitioning protein
MRLLKLAPAVRSAVGDGRLSEGHGRALLALIDEEDQIALARRVMNEGLTVRQAERLARDEKAVKRARRPSEAGPGGAAAKALEPHLAAYSERLQRALGTRVEVHPAGGAKGGRIVIHYYEDEDLDRIAEAVGA